MLNKKKQSNSPGAFLSNVIDELLIYKTQDNILKYIINQKFNFLIQNPPYKIQK